MRREKIIRRFRLTLSYDGTAYSGWQVQPNGLAVQEVLEGTLSGIVKQTVRLHGSGRTDRGVHARAQVAHADLLTSMNGTQVERAMNSTLPEDIRISAAQEVSTDFEAGWSVLRKEYRYFIWNAEVLPPCERLYTAHVRRPLDVVRMQAAADLLVGVHDFVAFSANPNREVVSTVREIYAFRAVRRGSRITLSVTGSGFLYKMVRGLSGWLIRVGGGMEDPADTADVLQSHLRTPRVPSAPAKGLFLWKVTY